MNNIMNSVRITCCVLCLLALPVLVAAAEVDQFTKPEGQPVELTDSAPILDAEINRRLEKAIQRANSRIMKSNHKIMGARWLQPRCDEDRLYQMLIGELGGSVVGQVESLAEESDQIDRRRIDFAHSIYRDFDWQSSPTLVLSERLAAVIKLAGVEVGADKLGHFFTEGYSYFLATEQLHKGPEAGLLFGEWSESVYFGAQTTGVFSYADLTANFQGMRFWNRILARQIDPLAGAKPKAYVECKNDRWRQSDVFHWQEYVDIGWDERVNCPVLRDAELLKDMVMQGAHCNAKALPLRKYGKWQDRLMNRSGYGLLPAALQPEVVLKKRVEHHDIEVSEETLQYIGELRERLEVWRRESIRAAHQGS